MKDQRDLRIVRSCGCCVATLEGTEFETVPQPGFKLNCLYCYSGLVLAEDGVWEWQGAKEVEQ